jgi:NAD(P)-dependent dehydrogenase (short-subunit alcohol dehydrogenase family)
MARVAIITGASRGLGAVIARFLAGEGYTLILTARGREALESFAAELARFQNHVITLMGDVSEIDHQRNLIQAAQAYGRLDLVVNNASDLGLSPLPPLTQYPLDALVRLMQINVIAPIGLVQAALPLLKSSGGLVVNISSDAAVGGYAGWGGYGASKAALDLASLTLANELRDEGVGVVSVDPGDMRTEMHQQAFPGEDISDRPLPEVTQPFWAWLFSQDRLAVSGKRYQAQGEHWEAASEAR